MCQKVRKEIENKNKGERLCYLISWKKLDKEVMLLAVDPECDVNYSGFDGSTSLINASIHDHYDLVEALLERQDLEINNQNENGQSALMCALFSGNAKCVKLLLDDPRIDINLLDNYGHSALLCAFGYNRRRICYIPQTKLLLSRGANVEEVFIYVQNTPFLRISANAAKVINNWKLYFPEFTRNAKTNKYYPTEFKERAFNFILCCLKSKSFPKDIIYLLLEYIARAWKRT